MDGRGVVSYSYSHYATIVASRMSETNDYRPGRRICIMLMSLLGGNEGHGSDNLGPGGPRFKKAFHGLQVEERCMAHQGTDDGQVNSKVGRFMMWMYNSA